MNFNLKRPCKNCPFRHDVSPYVTPGRAEQILEDIIKGQGSFTCHKTLRVDEFTGELTEASDSEHCAGALILLEKIEQPNQMMRIMERIGVYDRTQLDMNSPVYDSPEDMLETFETVGKG